MSRREHEHEQQHALAEHREARRQIYGGRGLPDPTLLIGDRDDFGWHCGGLNEKRGWVSSVERFPAIILIIILISFLNGTG